MLMCARILFSFNFDLQSSLVPAQVLKGINQEGLLPGLFHVVALGLAVPGMFQATGAASSSSTWQANLFFCSHQGSSGFQIGALDFKGKQSQLAAVLIPST